MSSEARITTTIFITLIFGVFSSALVNSVTEGNKVNWSNILYHVEFYILILLGMAVIKLAKSTAAESSEQWVFIKEKLEAIQSQGILVSPINDERSQSVESNLSAEQPPTYSRTLEFTAKAKHDIEAQEPKVKDRIFCFLYWLQNASVSEIIMNPKVRTMPGNNPTSFVLRVGDLRISVDADLQNGKIVVQELRKPT
jgi:hypothetical protein